LGGKCVASFAKDYETPATLRLGPRNNHFGKTLAMGQSFRNMKPCRLYPTAVFLATYSVIAEIEKL
jgi:hypothetical protein